MTSTIITQVNILSVEPKVYTGRFMKRLRTQSTAHDDEPVAKKARTSDTDEDVNMTAVDMYPKDKRVAQEERPAHLPLPTFSRLPRGMQNTRHKLLGAPYRAVPPKLPSSKVIQEDRKTDQPATVRDGGGKLRRTKSFVTPAVPGTEPVKTLRRVAQSSANLRDPELARSNMKLRREQSAENQRSIGGSLSSESRKERDGNDRRQPKQTSQVAKIRKWLGPSMGQRGLLHAS